MVPPQCPTINYALYLPLCNFTVGIRSFTSECVAVNTVANPWEALVEDEDDRYFAAVMQQTPAEGQRYYTSKEWPT